MLGICLVVYSIILPFSEASIRYLQLEEFNYGSLTIYNSSYSGKLMILTSVTTSLITIILQHYQLVSEMVSSIVISMSLSKLVALYIEVPFFVDSTVRHSFFVTTFTKSSLLFILSIRIIFFSVYPIKQVKDRLTAKAGRIGILKIYIFFIFPAVIMYFTPSIIIPLILKIWGFEHYYSHHPHKIVESAEAMSLWGILVFIFIRALYPDDRCFLRIKQISYACFLIFLGVVVFNVVQTTQADMHLNPYLSISNRSTTLRRLTGFWVVVAAGLAVMHLFIVSSICRLYHPKSPFVALYSVFCSIGISFFTIQLVAESENIILSLILNILISCTHTITTIYSVGEKAVNFSKTVHVAKITHIMSFAALCTAVVSGSIVSVGTIFSIFSFSLSLVIKMRKEKNTKTKSLGNISSILSWFLVLGVSYKQFGLFSFNSRIERFIGMPVSKH